MAATASESALFLHKKRITIFPVYLLQNYCCTFTVLKHAHTHSHAPVSLETHASTNTHTRHTNSWFSISWLKTKIERNHSNGLSRNFTAELLSQFTRGVRCCSVAVISKRPKNKRTQTRTDEVPGTWRQRHGGNIMASWFETEATSL